MCSTTSPEQLELPVDRAAPHLAREFLRDRACPVHGAGVLDEAVLLVSELVTNAVEHGAPPVTVRVECRGALGLQVCVSDGSVHQPRRGPEDRDAESGRGVALVDLVSDAWGVEPLARGKQVWFRLHPPSLPTAA